MTFSTRVFQAALLIVGLGLTSVLIVGVWSGKEHKPQEEASADNGPEAEMKLTDMEYSEMQGGRCLWTLKAEEARYFQDQQKTLLTSVHVTFFQEDGSKILLESHNGALHAGTKDIELWNSVKADFPNQYELTTDRSYYDHEKKLISSETPIRLRGPEVDLRGERWQYKIAARQSCLEGGVRASLVFLPPAATPREGS